MEENEKDAITNNVSKLMSLTQLDPSTLAVLIQKKILSSVEGSVLTWSCPFYLTGITHDNGCNSVVLIRALQITKQDINNRNYRFYVFYQIIVTKAGGYAGLIDAFEETRQTGAVALLKSAVGITEPPQDAYPWPTLVVPVKFKLPQWRDSLLKAKESCSCMTIVTMSTAVTKLRIEDLVGADVKVEGVKVDNDNVIRVCDKIRSKHGTRVNNADMILLEGPTSTENYVEVHSTCELKSKTAFIIHPIGHELQRPEWNYVYDLFTWDDILDKHECANNLVAFQIPTCHVPFAQLNMELGGKQNHLYAYLIQISELNSEKNGVKIPFTDEFVSFVEGKIPLICTVNAKPTKHEYVPRTFTCEKIILKEGSLLSSSLLLVVSGTCIERVTKLSLCRNGDVLQMPCKHDANISILVLEEASHELQSKQFQQICEYENFHVPTERLVAWFHCYKGSDRDRFILVKAVKSGEAKDVPRGLTEKHVIIVEEDKLVEENLGSDNAPVCIVGERGYGLSAVAHSLAWKLAQKKLLTCILDSRNLSKLFQSHLSVSNFVRIVWETTCSELVETWIRNSSKVICHVFFDNIHELDKQQLEKARQLVDILTNTNSIKVWVCGTKELSTQVLSDHVCLTYKINSLDFTNVRNLVCGMLKFKIPEKINYDEVSLTKHVRKFISNWSLITGETKLSVIGNPQSVVEYLKFHRFKVKAWEFDYMLIGVVYHKFVLARIKPHFVPYQIIMQSEQNEFVRYLKALYIINPSWFTIPETENRASRLRLRQTLMSEVQHDHVIAFFINSLIAHHDKLGGDLFSENIHEFASFLSSFIKNWKDGFLAILHNCNTSGFYYLTHMLVFACGCVQHRLMDMQFRNTLYLTMRHGNVNVIQELHNVLEINECVQMRGSSDQSNVCYCLEAINVINDGRSKLHTCDSGFQAKNYFYASLLSYVLRNKRESDWAFLKLRDLISASSTNTQIENK